ncbi:cytoplasmic protein NCK2-like [Lampetra fluviatilis]
MRFLWMVSGVGFLLLQLLQLLQLSQLLLQMLLLLLWLLQKLQLLLLELAPAATVAVARYDYTAGRPDELSLSRGARVAVTDKGSDGWWRGHLPGGATGWFPGNYVAAGASEDSIGTAAATGSGGQRRRGQLDVAAATSSEELSFALGEHLEMLGKPLDDPEWWHCRRADGATGLVPRNYVRQQLLLQQQLQQLQQQQPLQGTVSRFPGRPWYRGSMSRHMAEAELNERGENGDFVVRDSESSPSDLSLSVRAAGRNRHFKVGTAGGVFRIGQRLFDSMDALVAHYGEAAPIFSNGAGERLFLVRPLP